MDKVACPPHALFITSCLLEDRMACMEERDDRSLHTVMPPIKHPGNFDLSTKISEVFC